MSGLMYTLHRTRHEVILALLKKKKKGPEISNRFFLFYFFLIFFFNSSDLNWLPLSFFLFLKLLST